MGLFVGTALLNACHRLVEQLGDAESLISTAQGPEPDLSPQTRFHTCRYAQSLLHMHRNPVNSVVNIQLLELNTIFTNRLPKGNNAGLMSKTFQNRGIHYVQRWLGCHSV